MVKWQTVRHQVAIAGRLADAGTGKPVSGALVTINEDERTPAGFKNLLEARAMQYGDAWAAMTERPDRARTAPDGLFYFLDLPDGDYTLSASLAGMGRRYGGAEAKATVSHNQNGDYNRVFLELALQATTVRGKITGAAHRNGVAMAEVRVKGSGERTFSDARGQYVLAGIEPVKPKDDGAARDKTPKRTILVFAQGYKPDSKQVAINVAGAVVSLDFKLAPEAG